MSQAVNSIVSAICKYFMECPLLKDGVFRVDALGDQPQEYSIEMGIGNAIVENYVDGSSVRQKFFTFASREFYSLDRIQNIENDRFYEKLADWIEEQNAAGNLPQLPEGMEAEQIIIQAPGYMLDANEENARYQIQLSLQYFKEA